MNFRQRSRDEPEINLIPFIDVLLVVLIFLMLTCFAMQKYAKESKIFLIGQLSRNFTSKVNFLVAAIL